MRIVEFFFASSVLPICKNCLLFNGHFLIVFVFLTSTMSLIHYHTDDEPHFLANPTIFHKDFVFLSLRHSYTSQESTILCSGIFRGCKSRTGSLINVQIFLTHLFLKLAQNKVI